MPAQPLPRDAALELVRVVAAFHNRGYPIRGKNSSERNAIRAAAECLNINRRTADYRLQIAEKRYGITVENLPALEAILISEDSDRPHPIDTLDRHTQSNAQYIAKKRMKPAVFMVKPEPFAIAFVGDPHLSNAGCNLAALREDLELLRIKGIRAVQMGDVLDNFHKVGKLAEKEAQNRMSLAEGLSVAEWMICESGVKWDAHILGNHDAWLGYEGMALMANWVARGKSRLFDWNARLIYKWDGGQHYVFAAHDMKGSSIYNPLHGPAKMAIWDGAPDTYVAAHRHEHGEQKIPNGWRGKTYQLARVRGYKDHDSYAAGRAQFPAYHGMEGRSALLVINPSSETHDGRQRVFMDLAEGIEFLEMLKGRAT